MKTVVKSDDKGVNLRFKHYIEKRLKRFYRKASDSAKQITFTLRVINGPKGGLDKQCKLQLSLTGQPPIMLMATK